EAVPAGQPLPRRVDRGAHEGARRDERTRVGVGPSPSRPRRPHLHRPARPLRDRPARLPSGHERRGVRPRRAPALRARGLGRGPRRRARGGQRQPEPGHGRDRAGGDRDGGPGGIRHAAVPARRGRPRRRDAAPDPPRPRPAPRRHARRARPAPRRHRHHAPRARRAGLPRGRDADPHPLDPRGRARLPRARAPAARFVVRAAPVPAALQAAPDDGRLRALLPDRPLLPRRGPARRPPARVHPARPRDVLRGGGGRHRDDGSRHGRGLRHGRLGHARPAVAADDLRRGGPALRHRPAGHALRPGDPRPLRPPARLGLQGLRVRAGRRRRRARDQRRAAHHEPVGARGPQRGRPAPRR
ncbi:MAG: Aspartyl-tRNA synthetase @ Aspartyl-tRNA(Asn) synthetase, partial [uncultured Solirubrobacteraceae bacterium]